MTVPGGETRWWGWGEDAAAQSLPPAARELLARELGIASDASVEPPVPLADVRLPKPSLDPEVRARLEAIVGARHVYDDRLSRVLHAAGKSYPDLLRLRAGDAGSAPDAVVYPESAGEVQGVVAACSEARVACVPFGGGTSVVGGVEPKRSGLAAAVTIDLRRMDRLLEADSRSLIGRLEAGTTGPRAEEQLARRGLTLGHFPQSFEYATLGGFVATRSAGQASTGYGRIDELVLGLRCTTPAGEIVVRPQPASAAGPSLRDLLVGSEGTLGVITEVTLSLRPAPRTRRYEAWSFRRFGDGVEAFRRLEQRGIAPAVARLSDAEETRVTLALAGGDGRRGSELVRRGAGAYLRVRGHAGGCVAILGYEGDPADVGRRRTRGARLLRSLRAAYLGRGPGAAWRRGRFRAPYLRDQLLDHGVLVETLETATTWTALLGLHERVGGAIRDALSARGTAPVVMCHLSHLYPAGASLYYTFMARRSPGEELDQWRAAKRAATDAIIAGGGTLTHHHAVGSDHAPWMPAEVGELGLDVLRAVKARLDPEGVMNPGKLLPAGGDGTG